MISLLYHEKGIPLRISALTRYCTDVYFNITQILLLFTNGSLLNLISDISMISFLYHEKDISLRISELCQCNIQILYPKPDIAAICMCQLEHVFRTVHNGILCSRLQMRICENDGVDFLDACKTDFETHGSIRSVTCRNKKTYRNNGVCPGEFKYSHFECWVIF